MFFAPHDRGYSVVHNIFGLGKINVDQVHDYSKCNGMDIKTAERWLSPVLGYDTE